MGERGDRGVLTYFYACPICFERAVASESWSIASCDGLKRYETNTGCQNKIPP